MRRLPVLLVALRAACGPAIVLAERRGASGSALAAIVAVAFVSDVFDGIIARRLGVVTEGLRRADTAVDSLFYACALAALWHRAPDVLRANVTGLGLLVGLELVRLVLEHAKYGRVAAYHMWSAKLWGIALWLGFSEGFLTAAPGPLFQAAVWLGVAADLEGLCASLVLSRWRHDVPSLWHALRLQRGAS